MKIDNLSAQAQAQAKALAINLAQEAMETATQTRAEAAHGDRLAIQKLAKINAQKVSAPANESAAAPVSNAPDSTGTAVNVKA